MCVVFLLGSFILLVVGFFEGEYLFFKNFSDKIEACFSLCKFSTWIFPVRHDILVEDKKSECVWFMKIHWHGGNKDKIVPLVAISKDFQCSWN